MFILSGLRNRAKRCKFDFLPGNHATMNLLVDIGNTRVKMALSDGQNLLKVKATASPSVESFKKFIGHTSLQHIMICTGISLSPSLLRYLKQKGEINILDSRCRLPFRNLYRTPHTLGPDRMAAIAGAITLFPRTHLLVADFGTAITYDLVNNKGEYLGGNISPGLEMRFRALHEFTGKLPRCHSSETFSLTGTSTREAIINGVQQGLLFEVDSYIRTLRKKIPSLKIIFTGGDAIFFEKNLKYPIFTYPNLVLTGLNRILNENS